MHFGSHNRKKLNVNAPSPLSDVFDLRQEAILTVARLPVEMLSLCCEIRPRYGVVPSLLLRELAVISTVIVIVRNL